MPKLRYLFGGLLVLADLFLLLLLASPGLSHRRQFDRAWFRNWTHPTTETKLELDRQQKVNQTQDVVIYGILIVLIVATTRGIVLCFCRPRCVCLKRGNKLTRVTFMTTKLRVIVGILAAAIFFLIVLLAGLIFVGELDLHRAAD